MPIIGLLSDSHGDVTTTNQAVQLLLDAGAEILIHLGDLGSEAVIDALVINQDTNGQLVPAVHIVPGNTDWNAVTLLRYAASLGIQTHNPAGRITLDDKTIAFTHGHDLQPMQTAINEQLHYLCHGHTHQSRDEQIENTRVINPGALHRAPQFTVATLNTESDHLRFIKLD